MRFFRQIKLKSVRIALGVVLLFQPLVYYPTVPLYSSVCTYNVYTCTPVQGPRQRTPVYSCIPLYTQVKYPCIPQYSNPVYPSIPNLLYRQQLRTSLTPLTAHFYPDSRLQCLGRSKQNFTFYGNVCKPPDTTPPPPILRKYVYQLIPNSVKRMNLRITKSLQITLVAGGG